VDFGLALLFGIGIIGGIYSAIKEDRDFRLGKRPGVKSSKNLISYLFCDHD
jgi:hypothetical protein